MTSRADLLQTEAAKRLFRSLVPVLIPNDNAGFFAMCLRDIEEEAAAISSSSATETQDGERPCLCGTDAALARGATAFVRMDIVCPKHDLTPTPDDRDREVERIDPARLLAAMYATQHRPSDDGHDLDGHWDEWVEAIADAYDAGLRASGGTAE